MLLIQFFFVLDGLVLFYNRTPLYIAALAGYTQIVLLLLESGAEADIKDVVLLK